MNDTNGPETRSWYRSAGLTIMSAIPLDDLAPAATPGVADLTIERMSDRRCEEFASTTEHVLTIGEQGAPWLEVLRGQDGYLARWPDRLDVLIPDGGTSMLVHERAAFEDSVARLLLCQSMSFVLPAHGREGMHASAVEIDGRAVIVSGRSGRGKSTLATALCREGATLLADDLTSIRLTEDGEAVVDHGSHRTWMWRALAERMVGDDERHQLERAHKVAVDGAVREGPVAPVPVGAVYLLGYTAGRPEVSEPIPVRDAVRGFVSGLFNLVLKDEERMRTQFAIATAVAATAPTRVLKWEVGVEAARELARTIIEQVRSSPAPVRHADDGARADADPAAGGTNGVQGSDALTPAPERKRLLEALADAGLSNGVDDGFDEPLLRTAQVAALLRTSDRTVRTWAEAGKLTFIKTLGGRRLFPASGVMDVLNEMRGASRGEG